MSQFPEMLQVEVLSAYSQADLLIRQAKQFQPNVVVIGQEEQLEHVKSALWDDDIKVYAGEKALCDVVGMSLEQTMAVGDSSNDMDMLAVAGLAVAMGNSTPEVLAMADAVTEDCDHDGCALAIERYMMDRI